MEWKRTNSKDKYKKPITRNSLRVFCGKVVYTALRWAFWYSGKQVYTTQRREQLFKNAVMSHGTPLLRPLKNVDMWLQHNKITNLKLAVDKVDGIILQPGETFSYWRLIGMPHRFKGYKQGVVLDRGQVKPGIGGGLCQLSNLIFWITLHTPLTITERYRHSFDVFPDKGRTQPFGSGATCVYNYRDLQIKNDTKSIWQLKLWVTEEQLQGTWFCETPLNNRYEIAETDHRIETCPWGGYIRRNTLVRNIYNEEGTLVKEEWICDNEGYMMYEPLLSHNMEGQTLGGHYA